MTGTLDAFIQSFICEEEAAIKSNEYNVYTMSIVCI